MGCCDRPESEWLVRAPDERLRAIVDPYVGYRSAGRPPGVHRALPTTRVILTLSFDEPLRLTVSDRTEASFQGAMVAGGLRVRAIGVHHGGAHHGLQVSLSPSGCRALLGVPAAALEGQVVDLREHLPLDYDGLAAAGWEERFDALDRTLLRAAAEAGPAPTWQPELDRVWSLLAGTQGAARVQQCAEVLGWSRRRLHERFKGEFGITPKQAGRLCRFEASRRRIARGDPLVTTAIDCGYADQSHLNREWREMAGGSPLQWLTDDQSGRAAVA